MSNSIEAVLRGIEEELGQPLQLPPLPPDIRPFPHEGEKPQLFGSTTAIEGRLYLAQGHIRSFLAEAPDGYLVLGFWGYGINSYSFYYCSATPEARIFLRLPYGGVYMEEREREAIPPFFAQFTPFLERVQSNVSSLQLVESMGYSSRRFDLRSGGILEETEPSLYPDPGQWGKLWARVNGSLGGEGAEPWGRNRAGEVGMPREDKTQDFRSRMLDRQVAWREAYCSDLEERGTWQGRPYDHILPAREWVRNLWPGIEKSIPEYLRENKVQAHVGKHNLLSSWVLGASLYFPFGEDEEGRALLADFLRTTVDPRIRAVTEVALEFVDEGELRTELLLGEKGGARGAYQTSPDVGVRVSLEGGGQALILIEVKFCESNFSSCSARKRELLPEGRENECDDLEEVLGDPDKKCAQHRCYSRRYFDHLGDPLRTGAAARATRCPAAVNGYQLFRQQALAEALANSGSYDLVASALAYHADSVGLAKCLKRIGLGHVGQWGSLFVGRSSFVAFTHQAWVDHVANSSQSDRWRPWLEWAASRYALSSEAND
ncbi:MAG TPA: hypothetical protein VFC03_08825 [Acidimicrobiales bacterium]|nr:hypothetical protein [Acidimicrobiales bacterium]